MTYLTASMAPPTSTHSTHSTSTAAATCTCTSAMQEETCNSPQTEIVTDNRASTAERRAPTELPALKSRCAYCNAYSACMYMYIRTCHCISFRRFFSSGAANSMPDETPSDLDVTSKLRAKRRLDLMPEELGDTRWRLSASLSGDAVLETPTQSGEEEVTTPPRGRERKRHISDSEQNIRSKLRGFHYSSLSAKKVKHSSDASPLSQLDQDLSPTSARDPAPNVSPSPVKNPFAKNKTSLRRPSLIAQGSNEGDDATETGPTVGSLSDKESIVTQTSLIPTVAEESSSASTQSLPPTNTFPLPSTPSATPSAAGRSFMTSEDFITKRPHTLLNHVIALAQSDNGSDSQLSRHPTFPSQEVL